MAEIFNSEVLSLMSLRPVINLLPVNLLPVSLTTVVNCRFSIAIDVDMVIDTDYGIMNKVVNNGRKSITCVLNTNDKCIGGDPDGCK